MRAAGLGRLPAPQETDANLRPGCPGEPSPFLRSSWRAGCGPEPPAPADGRRPRALRARKGVSPQARRPFRGALHVQPAQGAPGARPQDPGLGTQDAERDGRDPKGAPLSARPSSQPRGSGWPLRLPRARPRRTRAPPGSPAGLRGSSSAPVPAGPAPDRDWPLAAQSEALPERRAGSAPGARCCACACACAVGVARSPSHGCTEGALRGAASGLGMPEIRVTPLGERASGRAGSGRGAGPALPQPRWTLSLRPTRWQAPGRTWAAAASWCPSAARTSCSTAACTWASTTT